MLNRRSIIVFGVTALMAVTGGFLVVRNSDRLFSTTVPRAVFEGPLELGAIQQGKIIDHTVLIHNRGTAELLISGVRPFDDRAAKILGFDRVIAPGEAGNIRLRIDTTGMGGPVQLPFSIRSNDPEKPRGRVTLQARVVRPIELEPDGVVTFLLLKGQSERQDVLVTNYQPEPLHIVRIASSNPIFRTTLQPLDPGKRYRLEVQLDPNTEAGKYDERITLATDSKEFPELIVKARARVWNLVSASPEKVDFGYIRYRDLDDKFVSERSVLVKKHQGTDFRILRATTDCGYCDVKITPEKSGESLLVEVKINKTRARPGKIEGTLLLNTNDSQFPELRLPIQGTLL